MTAQDQDLQIVASAQTESTGGVDLTPLYRAERTAKVCRILGIIVFVVVTIAVKLAVRAALR
jgi:hypothetical protein